jgi:serine/threonine-protein kinase
MASGRYVVYKKIASGGMATVHLGCLRGAAGFSRLVAVKRLHSQYARDPEFVAMLVDEARLAGRIAHPNVVTTLDVVSEGREILLVMEFVRGLPLSRLLRAARAKGERVPPQIAAAIASDVLSGLHAAHEARNEAGEPLGIVHRDVSPQNVLVGIDGSARVLDFGIAKASGRWQSTRNGQLKGKLPYMAPEQISTGEVTPRSDVYAVAAVLWEVLTGMRLFHAENEAALIRKVQEGCSRPPSHAAGVHVARFDRIVLRGLERNPSNRFGTAREMAEAIDAIGRAPAREVGDWIERIATDDLDELARSTAEIERGEAAAISVSRAPAEQGAFIEEATATVVDRTPSTSLTALVFMALLAVSCLGAAAVALTAR